MNEPQAQWWRYYYAGLQVASQVEVPEWFEFACTPSLSENPGDADVLIRLHAPQPLPSLADLSSSLELITGDESALTVTIPETARYTIRSGTSIDITPAPNVGAPELRLFLLGSAWGALSYQRGWLPLHAGVVQVGDGAVAFCAYTGGGKSSLSAWLTQMGYPLLSDDLCRLDVAPSPQVWRAIPRIKLWRDAIEALDWGARPMVRDHVHTDKFHFAHVTESEHTLFEEVEPEEVEPEEVEPEEVEPEEVEPEEVEPEEVEPGHTVLPLRAIYLLGWGEFSIERLTGARAVREFVAAGLYRPEFLAPLGLEGDAWTSALHIAQQVPIFALQRPRAWEQMPRIADLLIEHWRNHNFLTSHCLPHFPPHFPGSAPL